MISAEDACTYVGIQQSIEIDNTMFRKETHGKNRYELDYSF